MGNNSKNTSETETQAVEATLAKEVQAQARKISELERSLQSISRDLENSQRARREEQIRQEGFQAGLAAARQLLGHLQAPGYDQRGY